MDLTGTEGIAEVDEGGVNKYVLLRSVKEVLEVFEMPVTASNSVTCTVLVQDKDLTRSEPTLEIEERVNRWNKYMIS